MCKAWEDQRLDGIREGELKGRNNMLYSLVQDGDLNIEVAAKKINMTVDEFKSAMKEADYKVPVDWESFVIPSERGLHVDEYMKEMR